MTERKERTTTKPARKPNRKRGVFVGVWLDKAEHAQVLALSNMTLSPGSLSAGLRHALHCASAKVQP
jgi:hypothetical protein